MIYGDEKRLQMARSILPSRRSFRKDRQQIHQAARRAASARLRSYDEDKAPTAREDPRREVRGLVRWRRALDKLRHFEHWAERVTAALPAGARLPAMRALLPRDLIGQHALGHLRALDHFAEPGELAMRQASRRRWEATRAPVTAAERRRLLGLVGRHGEAWALLCAEVGASHRSCQWPLGRAAVEVARTREGWAPLEPARFGPVGPRRAPLRLEEPQEGPTQKPRRPMKGTAAPPDAAEQEAILLLIEAAAAAPRTVPAGARTVLVRERLRRGRWQLRRSPTLPNPASHPEWLAALDRFLQRYRNLGGDLGRVRRGY